MQRTDGTNRWEVPSPSDPANYSLQLQRIAEQIEREFSDLEPWSDHMAGSNTEVGAPAILREKTTAQAIGSGFEQYLLWQTNTYDNTGLNSPSGTELYLPDQDQRYWWWIGLNVLAAPLNNNLRYTIKLHVQDYDPASGMVDLKTQVYKQYMMPVSGTGNQFMMMDGLFRSGGGRVRATFHTNQTPFGTDVDVLPTSSIWAVRVCPDR